MDFPSSHRLRRGRFSISGQRYLLTTSVRNRQPIFRDLQAARITIRQMRIAHETDQACSLAWVLMPDHLHWLVELRQASLASLMRQLKYRSTFLINRACQRQGPLWQQGFHDRALRRDEDVRTVARYIVANPIRAGLVSRAGLYSHWDATWL
ncbi:MAG: transposase [Paucimonas sp.]|jgi:REP element-mobilizing transposase RayT|uniref:REP-associated tyrosine transposase n=1 Tax=Pantoea sp. Cy-639 TaxID=2608360 RepID=UPI001420B1A2|nr:transposase [Pantoea sp. Cy-639]MDR2308299.1 transposase [Paucimonas sp.]NIF19720.1 transposase [Pantoea sp. Cy-639]